MHLIQEHEIKKRANEERPGPYCVNAAEGLKQSSIPYFLYEANAWLGGRSSRTLIVKSLSGYQPSFDAVWATVLQKKTDDLSFPFGLGFGQHDYSALDQLAETKPHREETQIILGLVSLAVTGGCTCVLQASSRGSEIEIFEQSVRFWTNSKKMLSQAEEILQRYGVLS